MIAEPAYLLDTNICIYVLEGPGLALRARLDGCDRGLLVTSAIVYAEVMVGAAARMETERATALFAEVPPRPFDRKAADAYAALPFKRGSLDRLIAAHAISLDLILVTNDARHFADIPGLRVENWTR